MNAKMSYYLFIVYDCNDESTMKVIGRHKEGAETTQEMDELAQNFMQHNPANTETTWCEIFKLCGRRGISPMK